MRNRPTSPLDSPDDSRRSRLGTGSGDARPCARLLWVYVFLVAPLLGVTVRLVQLQCLAHDAFLLPARRTTVEYETIPTRDGRILSADGHVLAYDEERFRVLVHYRWIEDPPDQRWLRELAAEKLREQRDHASGGLDAAMRELLVRREALWRDLAQLAGVPEKTLHDRRSEIQQRVERIVASVRESRRRRDAAGDAPPHQETASWPASWWHAVVRALTTPPHRESLDELVVEEQLDYHVVLEDVGWSVAGEIEAHPERFPGTRIEVTTRRIYPFGSLAAHVIGIRTPLSDEEIAERQSRFPEGDPHLWRRGERTGRSGIERSYNRRLHGESGLRRIVRSADGQVLSTHMVRAPQLGEDVVLTIPLALQQRAEQILDEVAPTLQDPTAGATLVALDVRSGAILAAAVYPRFDLQAAADGDPQAWQRWQDDPRRPLFPRITAAALPPGSVFKAVTAAALLDSRAWDPDEPFFCRGYLDRPDRYRCYIYRHYGVGHGEVDLTTALARSCNVYFFHAARRMGAAPLVEWAKRLGFGQPTGIDLPAEASGHLPEPPAQGDASAVRVAGYSPPTRSTRRWYPGDTLGLAIGQSRLTATPLQVVRMMAAIANGGRLIHPHVAGESMLRVAPLAADDTDTAFAVPQLPLSPDNLERLREGLRLAVAHPRGTAHRTVFLKQVAIAGKTGTAETRAGRNDHAWFAGYVPADRPRVAFAIVLEHAGSGGRAAGPVARRFVEALLEEGLIPATDTDRHEP